jgi:hypothetical protein
VFDVRFQIVVLFVPPEAGLVQHPQPLLGFVELSGFQIPLAKIFIRAAMVGLDIERLLVVLQGQIVFLEFAMTVTEQVPRARIPWFAPRDLFQQADRLAVLLGLDGGLGRLQPLTATAKARYALKTPYRDGATHPCSSLPWISSRGLRQLPWRPSRDIRTSLCVRAVAESGAGGCHDFLLTDCNGLGKPAYYAFQGFNGLFNTVRLSTTGTDHMNFAAIAGKSGNRITIVISNFDVKTYLDTFEPAGSPANAFYNQYVSIFGTPVVYGQFTVALQNLPWSASQQVIYERYRVDDQNQLSLVETRSVPGNGALSFTANIAAPSVQVIKVHL